MKPRSIGAILAVLVLGALPAAGQPTASDHAVAQLSEEMKGIRQSLDRMAALLEATRRHQQIDLVLKRIALRERRLKPLEDRLRSAESEVEGISEHLKSLDRMQAQHEEELDAEIRDGLDDPRSETRRVLADIERTRTGAEERLEAAYSRGQQYENELAHGKRQIEILDEMLGELLEAESR
jgi:chromosome segregation ATPase